MSKVYKSRLERLESQLQPPEHGIDVERLTRELELGTITLVDLSDVELDALSRRAEATLRSLGCEVSPFLRGGRDPNSMTEAELRADLRTAQEILAQLDAEYAAPGGDTATNWTTSRAERTDHNDSPHDRSGA